MKIDNSVIDSLFEESLSDENTEVNEMIDEVFGSSNNKKSIRIEVIAPNKIKGDNIFEEDSEEESREKIEQMLKEAVGSVAVDKVLSDIETEEKFSDYIDDSIYMRNQDINLTGIESALIRGCRIEKRLNSYRSRSEECKKECEKLMEYEFFQSLAKVMDEEKEIDLFEENKKIPYTVTEEEYLIIKDNIENFFKERLKELRKDALIKEEKSYIIVGETEEGEERIVGFIDDITKAQKVFESTNLDNKSLSLAIIEYLEEDTNKIILDYEILDTIK